MRFLKLRATLLVLTLAAITVGIGFRISAGQSADPVRETTSPGPSSSNLPAGTGVPPSYGDVSLSFEANQGQTDPRVKFISRGRGYTIFLTETDAVIHLIRRAAPDQTSTRQVQEGKLQSAVLRMRLDGAEPHPEIAGLEQLPGKANYFVGNDPARWRANIPTYAKVRYSNVYSGVDLVYYGKQRELEYDFVVAPGKDPSVIKLSLDGARNVEVENEGDVVVGTSAGEMRLHRPVLFQVINGKKRQVSGHYLNLGNHQLGFQVGDYDSTKPLVIDPVLSYSTFFGGSSSNDQGDSIAVDSAGNAYVVGRTASTNFPIQNALDPTWGGGFDQFGGAYFDGFISKLNATGTGLIYSTYIGGNNSDACSGIALDSTGNAYLTGSTSSTNFPTANPLQSTLRGYADAFVLKLNSSGSALLFSTYLGGDTGDGGGHVKVDSVGNIHLVGTTNSTNFPIQGAIQASLAGDFDLFIAKINNSGSTLLFSSYFGGSGKENSGGLALDSSDEAHIVGTTLSANFPTVNPLQGAYAGGTNSGDVFVLKLNASSTGIVYSTYLGGSADESARAVAVDSLGSLYITGHTTSTNFPTANALQPNLLGSQDAFVTKLSPTGSALAYSTYFGGTNGDTGYGIGVDDDENVYLVGSTTSSNFPILNAFQSQLKGGSDLFVSKLNATASALLYSTYLGGSSDEPFGFASMAIDSSRSVYITGSTRSSDFPTANPFQPNYAGGSGGGGSPFSEDAFIAKIADLSGFEISGRVTDAGGNPIPSATVTLSGSQNGSIQTNSNGEFAFASLAPGGNFTVTPTKQFHTFTPPSQTFNNLTANQVADFTGASFNVTISGRVLNGLSGGVSAVTVTLSGSQSSSVQTDSTGNYSFSSLPAGGNYTITPSRGSDTFNPANKTFNNLGSNQTADFILVYRISGRVLDGSGVGMAGVNVNLSGSQTATINTDSGGNYSFVNVPSNLNYTVTPVKAGYTLTYLFNPSSRSYTNLNANQTGDFSLTGTSTLATLNLIADSFVEDGSSAAVNFGIDESMKLQTRTQGPNRDAYFKVDLTSVTRSITSAKLSFFAATSTSSSITTSAYPVTTTTWIESGTGGITWNNKPARGTVISGASVSVAGTTYATYLIDVTPYIKTEKAAGRNVVSFALHNPSSSTSFITLNSREALTNKPQLVVTTSDTNNASPTVTITSPAGGSSYVAAATIPIVTTATDSDGTVSKVEFYAGTSLLGTNTQPDSGTTNRYTLNWSNVGLGSYGLTAVATDDSGSTGSSGTVGVVVLPPNIPPSVSLVSPVSSAVYSDGSSIGLIATASDVDGSISKVEFFDGSTLIGTSTVPSPPGTYTVAWSNAPTGVHSLTAKATDNVLGSTNSSAVSVNVVRQAALLPTADAYVADGSSASSNFGTALDLQSQLPPSGTGNKESYLKFDLTSVSAIVRARLRLNGNLTSGSNVPVAMHSVSNTAWTETGITWNNKPAATNPALSTTTISSSSPAWTEWDITTFVQTEKAAGRNTISLV